MVSIAIQKGLSILLLYNKWTSDSYVELLSLKTKLQHGILVNKITFYLKISQVFNFWVWKYKCFMINT